MADEAQRSVTRPDGTEPARTPVAAGGRDGIHPVAAGGEARAGQLSAGVLGAFSLVGGLLWILLNLHSPRPVVDVAVGVVLAAGGLVLLMPHRVRLPAGRTWAVAGAAALVGGAAGLAAHSAALGGMYAYVERRGFPFAWLSRGGVADDPDTARRLAATDAWNVNVLPLIGDVLVWAYAGILIFALVRRLRGVR
jgi:hypothetical protein